MADKIRANYPAMQEMAKHLGQVNTRLLTLESTIHSISSQLEGGVLQGQPGDAMITSLNKGQDKLGALTDVINQVIDGIMKAQADMEQADSQASNGFNS